MSAIPDFVLGNIIVTDYLGDQPARSTPSSGRMIYRVAAPGDDLQSAGLGAAQMSEPLDPAATFADPAAPTATELRRLAIHTNYRGLMDITPEGGFGLLFGHNLSGKIYGREYLALARAEPGDVAVTLLVQIPQSFNAGQPFIITGPASGSRGIYGANSIAEWAFANGCAIAYTDKGGGPGFHDLDRDTVYDAEGLPLPGAQAGEAALFRVPPDAELAAFKAAFPNRLGVKHAHSTKNPERNWGRYVLLSIEFAYYCLNDYFRPRGGALFTPANTRVIASGVSNGGGAALRAAEQDSPTHPLIDAVVVSEPQVQPVQCDFVISYKGTEFAGHSRSLLDIATLMDVYAPSAALVLDPSDPESAIQQARVQQSAYLYAHGLLKSADRVAQGHEALKIIHDYGILPDADLLLPFHQMAGFWRLLAMTYANAYGRARASDHLCGVSAAAIDENGKPVPPAPNLRAQMCGWGSGLAFLSPSGNVAYVDAQPVPGLNPAAALCFRSLVTRSAYDGQSSVGASSIDAQRIEMGIAEARATGRLRGKPTIIVHGRSDALIAPNHSSRPYYALNKMLEGPDSPTRYIEVINGNHFDHFIPLFSRSPLVPMHYYLDQALDLMRKHLLDPSANALPGSQVVPAAALHKPWNAGGKPWIDDLPDIAMVAEEKSTIVFRDKTLTIPGDVQ